jgi:hypothetical protein
MRAPDSPAPSSASARASTSSATEDPTWPPRASAWSISLDGVAPSRCQPPPAGKSSPDRAASQLSKPAHQARTKTWTGRRRRLDVLGEHVRVVSEWEHRIGVRAAFGRKGGAGQALENVRGSLHGRALDAWAEHTRDEVGSGVGAVQTIHVDVQLTV